MPAIHVLDAYPVAKAVLRENFVAEVPFSVITGEIPVVTFCWNHLGNRRHAVVEWEVVPNASVRVRHKSGHDTRPRRSAHRLCIVRALKHGASFRKSIQVRHFDTGIAVCGEGIEALFIGEDEEEIRAVGIPVHRLASLHVDAGTYTECMKHRFTARANARSITE